MKFKKVLFIFVILIYVLNISVSYADTTNEPNIDSGAAILLESSTEKILYSKNENQKMYPASTTKIMTAILTLENCNLDDVVSVPYEAIASIPPGYSVAYLQAGEQLTVEQLLQVLLVHSANDAANVLAYHISGSIDTFADLMNKKVEELGLKNTHFTNPSGKHDNNHYTNAYDLAILMKYCMKNTEFRRLTGLKNCIIPATNKYQERVFSTTNELLIYDNTIAARNYYYQYAIAGKTGYTSQAKNCLVSVSNKDNLELICVVLSAGIYPNNLSAKFIDTKSIFEYGYKNYTLKKLKDSNSIATQIEIPNASAETKNLDLLVSKDLVALVTQDNFDIEYEFDIKLDENLSAPIAQGQKVGTIIYNIDEIEYTSDLLASHSVKKSNFLIIIVQVILIVIVLYLLYKLLFRSNNTKKKYRKKYKGYY